MPERRQSSTLIPNPYAHLTIKETQPLNAYVDPEVHFALFKFTLRGTANALLCTFIEEFRKALLADGVALGTYDPDSDKRYAIVLSRLNFRATPIPRRTNPSPSKPKTQSLRDRHVPGTAPSDGSST